jgi:CheY-like chemotaxis protein
MHPVAMEQPMKQVLIVEDTQHFAEIIILTLQKEDIRTVHVSNGEDALNYLAEQLPDLMVLDIGLPDVTGWYILEALKERFEVLPFPVIVLTAFSDTTTKLVARMQKAVVRFLVKPLTPEQIKAAVLEALQT